VAILSTATLDAPTEIAKGTLTFGRRGDEPSLVMCNDGGEDVNRDGRLDLICHFSGDRVGFLAGDVEGILRGRTTADIHLEGRHQIRVIPQ
jgi:hypothetical protein